MSCIIDQYFKRNQDYRIQDLAHFVGTSPQMIYKILNSESKPNIYLALKITNFFNIYVKKFSRQNFNVDDFWVFDQMKFDDSS